MRLQEDQIKDIIGRFLNGTASPEEKAIVNRFFMEHREKELEEALNPREFVLLEQRLRHRIEKRISPNSSRFQVWKVAASLTIIVAVAALYLLRPNNTPPQISSIAVATIKKSTDKGQKITLRLPDGTMVKLNSQSSITFPEQFNEDVREVSLDGEAYFDVVHKPSHPFIVRTGNTATRVLGTSFNVNATEQGRTMVTLVSGRVNVESKNVPNAVELRPHQQAVINNVHGKIDTASVDVSRFVEWKDNVLRFENTPLSEAVSALENWYGVDIEIAGKHLAKCHVTGLYESESLENVLKSFSFMLKGRFTINGKKITLSGKGCNS